MDIYICNIFSFYLSNCKCGTPVFSSFCRTVLFIQLLLSQCKFLSIALESTTLRFNCICCWWSPHTGWLPFWSGIDISEMSGQVREMVNATEDLITVAWESSLQKLTQGYFWFVFLDHNYHFRALTETVHWSGSDLKYWDFSADYGGQDWVQHGGRILGQFLCRRRGYMRLSESRLHLPTSSCSNLWRNTISDRGGGLISAERNKPRGRTVRERVQHCSLLPYRPPSGGGSIS